MISAIHDGGGDVLKLIGDGTLAMFTGEDRSSACRAALAAARHTLDRVDELKQRRLARGLPATDIYLSLHPGEVVYGNFGSRERLDFTVVGPAVNEVSRIAAMCRLVDQPILVSCLSTRRSVGRGTISFQSDVTRCAVWTGHRISLRSLGRDNQFDVAMQYRASDLPAVGTRPRKRAKSFGARPSSQRSVFEFPTRP